MAAPDPARDDRYWLDRLSDPADRIASSEFADAFLPAVLARLRTGSPGLPDEFLVEAAGTAVLDFVKRPAAFDPARRSLLGYLVMAAEGDLKNLLKREGRHQKLRLVVELDELPGNETTDGDSPPCFEDYAGLMAVRDALPPPEREFLDLMRQGSGDHATFAAILGLEALPLDEQRAEVKRVRDRILKRLRRAARKEEP